MDVKRDPPSPTRHVAPARRRPDARDETGCVLELVVDSAHVAKLTAIASARGVSVEDVVREILLAEVGATTRLTGNSQGSADTGGAA